MRDAVITTFDVRYIHENPVESEVVPTIGSQYLCVLGLCRDDLDEVPRAAKAGHEDSSLRCALKACPFKTPKLTEH